MLTKVTISNYRSIASCEVTLGPLTFLVGLNGSGKSNFIDALRFCRDALRGPLDHAFAQRNSNLAKLSHWGKELKEGFALRFDLLLSGGAAAHYSFSIGPQSPRGFEVVQEECFVREASGKLDDYFIVRAGTARDQGSVERLVPTDRLYLVNASSRQHLRPVYDQLEGMEFYRPDPERMKLNDSSGKSDVLQELGRNIPSMLERITRENPAVKVRIDEYLRLVLPGFRNVDVTVAGAEKYLFFVQDSEDAQAKLLPSGNVSDGTLRALAVLVALFQRSLAGSRPTILAIEEPETGLHPAATETLLDALIEGAMFGQVIVTSHSADLLDNREIESDSILAVDASRGSTRIGPLDAVGRSTLLDHLYTAGELMRMGQLKPPLEGIAPEPVLFEA